MQGDYQKTLWKWVDPMLGLLRLWYKGFAGFFPVLFLSQLVLGSILLPSVNGSLKLAILSGLAFDFFDYCFAGTACSDVSFPS